jgi:dTDP-3-amino-3,4,6-trideoxy-alpha-D-glucose transaminase
VIQFLDLTRRLARHEPEFLEAVSRVMRSGTVLLGEELDAFEREVGSLFGAPHAIGVSSGAASLQLALAGLGVGPGDEVIVLAFTAVPTVSAVCAVGATPIVVDVDESTALIDTDHALDAVSARTRAIIPVHLYGRPVDVEPLTNTGIAVVQDAAQAHGAVRSNASAAVVYSFYPTKNIGGIGDGGAITTANDELAAKIRRLRVHGMTEQYVHVDVSQNFRLSEIEAAWLRLQLGGLAAANTRRREIARHYRESSPHLRWQADHPDHVFHLCVARFTDRAHSRAALADQGIGTAVQYPLAITQQPAYAHLGGPSCPRAQAWAAECVSLPCYPELTDAEVEHVATALASVRP